MSQANSEFWRRARRGRDKLAEQLAGHLDVSLIDIGRDPVPGDKEAPKRIVLRVHVRRPLTREALGLPEEMDGVPIRVVVADYRLE
jgi:hypothetical protein